MVTQKFWSNVKIGDECWVWTGHIDKDGYGRFGSKAARAHRVSYELFRGPVLASICVLHRCDNRPCIRPDHLFLGSRKSNADDREAKGRHPHPAGAKNGRAKLSEAQVADARERRRNGATITSLAREMGVGADAMGNAIRGQSFRAPACAEGEGEGGA